MAEYEFESFLEFNSRNREYDAESLKKHLLDVMYIDKYTKTAIRSIHGGIKDEIFGKEDLWKKVYAILNHKTEKNVGIFFAGFYADAKSYSLENVSCFKAVPIDVDFKKNDKLKKTDPKYILGMLQEFEFFGLPAPSIAEYGHQLRLIWVLEKPVFLPRKKSNPSKRKKLITLYRRIQTVICDRLNKGADLHAEPQQLQSLIRLPFSVNTKDGSMIGVEDLHGKRFELDTLRDEILGELPEWYSAWNEKNEKKSKKTKKTPFQIFTEDDYSEHNSQVLSDLVTIQKYYNDLGQAEGFRQNLCWVHFKYSYLVRDGDRSAAIDDTLKYNDGFLTPLRPERLKRGLEKCRVGNGLKNKTILCMADITVDTAKALSLSVATETSPQKTVNRPSYKKERAKLEKAGKTRKQQFDKRTKEIKDLIESGKRDTEISKILGICTRTIRNHKKIINAKAETKMTSM